MYYYISATFFLASFLKSAEPIETPKIQRVDVDFHYLDKDDVYKGYEYSYEIPLKSGEEEHKKIMIRASDYKMGNWYCELPVNSSHYGCVSFEGQDDNAKQEILSHFVQSGFLQYEDTAQIPNIFLKHKNNDDIAPKQTKSWNIYKDKSTRYNDNIDSLKKSAFKLERTAQEVERSKEITHKEIDLGQKIYCLTEQANNFFLKGHGYLEENGNPFYRKSCVSLDSMSFTDVKNLFEIFNQESLENRHVDIDTIAILSVNKAEKTSRSYSLTWKAPTR